METSIVTDSDHVSPYGDIIRRVLHLTAALLLWLRCVNESIVLSMEEEKKRLEDMQFNS